MVMKTVQRGTEFTGFVIGKCRQGHTTRFEVGVNFFRNGEGMTRTKDEWGRTQFVFRTGKCNGCDAQLRLENCKPVYGRFVEDKICDGRCMGATGNSCDCQCGGRNHGGRHHAA